MPNKKRPYVVSSTLWVTYFQNTWREECGPCCLPPVWFSRKHLTNQSVGCSIFYFPFPVPNIHIVSLQCMTNMTELEDYTSGISRIFFLCPIQISQKSCLVVLCPNIRLFLGRVVHFHRKLKHLFSGHPILTSSFFFCFHFVETRLSGQCLGR